VAEDTWERFSGDTFCGIPLDATPIVFLIDKSISMERTNGNNSRSRDDVSQQELERSLNILTRKGIKFNVITFARKTQQAFPDVVSATPGNISQALSLASRALSLRTNTYRALHKAYRMPTAPKKIYLLSDGLPTGISRHSKGRWITLSTNEERTAAIFPLVKKMDAGRGIKINTILINGKHNNRRDASGFMRRLAAATGGIFREIKF